MKGISFSMITTEQYINDLPRGNSVVIIEKDIPFMAYK